MPQLKLSDHFLCARVLITMTLNREPRPLSRSTGLVRQQVTDQITAAIRAHSLARAKLWDGIKEAVDRRVTA